jgi:hypothetical protein
MRLISLASALSGGLILGWAACAQGAPAAPASPPAEPVFYCPKPPPPAAKTAHRAPVHHRACPTQRVARVEHQRHETHWRGQDDGRLAERDGGDVSASQAFIYRYERALHGLDARAADAAWDGRRPRDPQEMIDNGPDWHGHDGQMGPPDHRGPGDRLPPPDRQWEAARAGPADHRDGDHMGPPDRRGEAEAALRADDGRHYGYLDERGQHGDAQGWSAGERTSGGEVREHVWTYRSESDSGWVSGDGHVGDGHGQGGHDGDRQWRDGSYGHVVEYAGRDAHGYLVWPGKTPPADIQPDPDPDHDR